ncbi:hypothetical protein Bhyg_02980 [Pseudolycoriella hygida]|uniref:HTH psq-type domain-containing protein n=1 Tax=Pseudolycoriella hygida TaxID=35572 RepID=A0A9Q0ND88_9DIPT|nr:hypothetical protein Bhyg_02980 [Pseudolycoriella hygida]
MGVAVCDCRLSMSKQNMFAYFEEDMAKALDAMSTGMSCRKAAVAFGIPKTTLLYKHTGKYPVKRKMGPSTVLSESEEKVL